MHIFLSVNTVINTVVPNPTVARVSVVEIGLWVMTDKIILSISDIHNSLVSNLLC